MKRLFPLLLSVILAVTTRAQNRDNVFAEVGCNEFGFSGTYDRKLTRHFEAGGGVDVYNFNYYPYANIYSGCYLDLRPYWSWKRGLLFEDNDVGIAVSGGRRSDTANAAAVTPIVALGVGYCYRINKRGWGPYVATGLYGRVRTVHNHDQNLTQRAQHYSVFDWDGILSIGFKF